MNFRTRRITLAAVSIAAAGTVLTAARRSSGAVSGAVPRWAMRLRRGAALRMIISNRYAGVMTVRRPHALAVPLAVAGLVLAGCTSTNAGADSDSGAVRIVASTSVYASLAEAIGGDRVEVTPIIASLSQDPHAYEASARDQLTISRADLIVENGGGYDSFIDGLIESTGTDAVVLTAVEYAQEAGIVDAPDHDDDGDEGPEDDHGHEHEHLDGVNEHVWYDLTTVSYLAADLAEHLAELDPEGAETYEANAAEFAVGMSDLDGALAEIVFDHSGAKVFVTEPVPLALTDAADLVNVTPAEFSEAVEEGQDVPPAVLLEASRLIQSGDISVVIANAQTGGAETTEVIEWAEAAGIPVVEFTELLPDGETYQSWMWENIRALADALG